MIRSKLRNMDHPIDIILSHTSPYSYLPRKMFLDRIDQTTMDYSTEIFLDKIEQTINYKAWYCGHFHTDKTIDRIIFMFYHIDKLKFEHQ